MSRGLSPEAFVTENGTIFISQALINLFDSVDQIGGVLAHELGHLLLETHKRSRKTKEYFERIGVGWIHEAAADTISPTLLEKAGLRSTGLIEALEAIPSLRGAIHQSNAMRGVEGMMTHAAIH